MQGGSSLRGYRGASLDCIKIGGKGELMCKALAMEREEGRVEGRVEGRKEKAKETAFAFSLR